MEPIEEVSINPYELGDVIWDCNILEMQLNDGAISVIDVDDVVEELFPLIIDYLNERMGKTQIILE